MYVVANRRSLIIHISPEKNSQSLHSTVQKIILPFQSLFHQWALLCREKKLCPTEF